MFKKKILIVEDNELISKVLQRELAAMNYDPVAVADSPDEAFAKIKEFRPDLVLMDIQLKDDTDGISAAYQIKIEFDLPVIYLTSLSDDETLQRTKITEPFAYLIKPVDERDLRAAIEVGLFKHKMEQERKQLTAELQQSLAMIKTLSGLLPICCSCKKIRDDQGYWNQVEVYLKKHSRAEFTHGICPDCAKTMRDELSG